MEAELASLERVVEEEAPTKVLAEHRARYAFACPHVVDRRVLDVASGSGYGTRMLHDAGAAEVVGVDCYADAVHYARERYAVPGIEFIQADASDLAPLGTFDVIVSFETLEHLRDPERFLVACVSALRPGGTFFVSSPYRHRLRPDGRPHNPFHVQEWITEEFDALLHRFFADVALYGQALKLEKGALPLPRRLARPLAALQQARLHDPEFIFPLPGPRFFRLWRPFPGYLLAVCRNARPGTDR